MAGDEEMAMQLFSVAGTAMGMASSMRSILGGTPPTAGEIAAAVAAEVKIIFMDNLTDVRMTDAAATLQQLRAYLFGEYARAIEEQNSNQRLSAILHDATAAPSLFQLGACTNALETWLDPANNPTGNCSKVSKALSICLGLSLHECLLRRERGLIEIALAAEETALADAAGEGLVPNATTTPHRKAAVDHAAVSRTELGNMRDEAKAALARLQSRVMETINGRMWNLNYTTGRVRKNAFAINERYFALMRDPWSNGGPNSLYAWSPWEGTDYIPHMKIVWHLYRRVLWDGQQSDYDALKTALANPLMNNIELDIDSWSRDQFVKQSLEKVRAFGTWALSARNLLMALDNIATGLPGTQEDHWHWCLRCGVLYHGGSAIACPAGGSHEPFLMDYVVHRLDSVAVEPSVWKPVPGVPNTLANFVRCAKCQMLQMSGTFGRCPAGGLHQDAASEQRTDAEGNSYTATANLYLCTGTPPPAKYRIDPAKPFTPGAQLGILDVHEGWRFCRLCGGVFNGAAKISNIVANVPSVCVAGGPHVTVDSFPPLWLTTLGGYGPAIVNRMRATP